MPDQHFNKRNQDTPKNASAGDGAPHISLPTGGGAIQGIGETFATNPVTGTGSLKVPITVSQGRPGWTPELTLTYDSGQGNGPFAMGWDLALPEITRRTDRGLPQYRDADESDIFILSGAEDLVPMLVQDEKKNWTRDSTTRDGYVIDGYRPRIEGLFARIERWTRQSDGDTYWRSISKDNVTTFYGTSTATRVADPFDPSRIFSWLIATSQDDKGNAIQYEYVPEDSSSIDLSDSAERNRTPTSRSANRYIKRIKYANTPSLLTLAPPDFTKLSWLFEVVFDYGEGHYQAQPPNADGQVFVAASVAGTQPWPIREDPFSRFRSCFEVRTYRLCQRVLVFHHFASELGTVDYLVHALEFTYQQTPVASFMTAVTRSGFVGQGDGTFLQGALPPLQFEYSQAEVQPEVRDVDPASLANLPAMVDGGQYRWLDLDGEGLQCVLAEQGDAWYYKRNLSPLAWAPDRPPDAAGPATARFEALTEVSRLPALAEPGAARHQFLNLAGDGRLDCVVFRRPGSGYYTRTSAGGWSPFAFLPEQPNIDWDDPNLRFIDVDGDGFSDVLLTDHEAITCFPSRARSGFGPPNRVPKAEDEEKGPAIVFADSTQSIFLADMSGDGLSDIVRIRDGEVCYWPNLGYGHFGAKVDMDHAPWFDAPDQFDPRRIRLADVDGSGVADIIYLGRDGVALYFNQSGNAWSGPRRIADFPQVGELASIQALDLLGNGTSCLVWTSDLPGASGRTIRYIDMMGSQKPYLLVRSWNNLGAETRVTYAPSTAFYLADREAVRPWATQLPFPVQVVARVETLDWVSRNRFVTRTDYHHGYFDAVEREFRGFGMVEQYDTVELGVLTETGAFPDATNIDAASYVPPVRTKTWYHTGAYPMGSRVTRIYDAEYFHEPVLSPTGVDALLLPDSRLPADLTGAEIHEAIRSLKGAILRQEVCALDGTAAACLPYSVSERNYTVCRLQPLDGNRHAVFYTHARESIDFQYERTLYTAGGRTGLADPRVTHNMTLAVDAYGNVLQSAAIAYGRRYALPDPLLTPADQAVQRTPHVTYTQNAFTHAILERDAYRAPLPAETCTYELIKVAPGTASPAPTIFFGFDELASTDPTSLGLIAQAADGLHDLAFNDVNAAKAVESHPYRRLIKNTRSLYRKDDLTAALPLGTVESLGLPFQTYQLAFTPDLLALYQRGTENLLPAPATTLSNGGSYINGDDQKTAGLFPATDPSGWWWAQSGRIFYSPGASDPPATELATARSGMFLPRRFRDPFGNNTVVTYDSYPLLLVRVQDPVQNVVTASNDYRVLQAALVTDPNGNQSAAAFDALGLVVGTAVMGKTGEIVGDTLTGFAADLKQAQIDQFFANPKGPAAAALLANATTRIVYDVGRFARAPSTPAAPVPVYAAMIARETHVAKVPQKQSSRLQVRFSYSDGFGREIQRKGQADPGPVVDDGPAVNPRWIGSGWTIYNNKGKPVRQYEPFFSATNDFEFGAAVGVSPTLFYDPVGRVVATLQPDQSWGKVVFDPWRQDTWDGNDTVSGPDPATDADVGSYFARIPRGDYFPTWYGQRIGASAAPLDQAAAQKAAVHAATQTTAYIDPLGRTFLTVAFNRAQLGTAPPVEGHYRTLVTLDIEGNQRSITDALGRAVMTYDYDMLGTRIHSVSVDAGERWILNDATGKPFLSWDSRNHQFQYDYDAARRPTGLSVQTGTGVPQLAEKTVYGEGQPSPTGAQDQARNLRGKVYQQFDGAGVATNNEFDVKGNLLNSSRELLTGYKDPVDWSGTPARTGEVFTRSSTFDALNRPVTMVTPDASVISPVYNEASLLAQLTVNLRGAKSATPLVTNIDYNAKAQRTLITYGNGAQTAYSYDHETFRLHTLTTSRASDNRSLQALGYTYDAVGNITHIADGAQQTIYFNNAVVDASTDYVYDAIYRLIQATGRELIGLAAQPQTTWDDSPRMKQTLPLPSDAQALRRYTESYLYDSVGNILSFTHQAAGGNWTRTYAYDEPNAPPTNNRLTSTTVGATRELPYTYTAHGSMTAMPHLSVMTWDFKDQLQSTQRQVVNGDSGATTYYVYDAKGQRIRKVNESASGTTLNERIYIGGYEVYREYDASGSVTLERDTLHIMDDKRRVALVETNAVDTGQDDGAPSGPVIRYQFDNLLGSVCLELDESAAIISYEEYYPFGSTSYQAGPNAAEVSLKQYRYTGKERDSETGLYYFGARYYASWLGRWTSCDPAGTIDGHNLYVYVRCNPVRSSDQTGLQTTDPPGTLHFDAEVKVVGKEGLLTTVKEEHDVAYPPVAGTAPAAPAGGPAPSTTPAPPQPSQAAPPSAPPAQREVPADAATTARETIHAAATPTNTAGEMAKGPMHLWSGPEAKAEAREAIETEGTGWLMGDIGGLPTQLHLDAAKAFETAKAAQLALTGSTKLPSEQFDAIWGEPSARVVQRAVVAGMPVVPHGTPGPIQNRFELPRLRLVGPGVGLSMFGTGMYSALSAGDFPTDHPMVGAGVATAGVGEATGGIMYGAGAYLGSGTAMAIGAGVARVGGGVGLAVTSAYMFSQDIYYDNAAAAADAAGVIGGILLTASVFAGPLAPALALAGLGFSLFSLGFQLGRFARARGYF
jgi:RHS repeat-associated protein